MPALPPALRAADGEAAAAALGGGIGSGGGGVIGGGGDGDEGEAYGLREEDPDGCVAWAAHEPTSWLWEGGGAALPAPLPLWREVVRPPDGAGGEQGPEGLLSRHAPAAWAAAREAAAWAVRLVERGRRRMRTAPHRPPWTV